MCSFILAISTWLPPLIPFPLVETLLLRSPSPTLMYFCFCDTELLMWEWVGNHLQGMCYCSVGTPLMRLTWRHPSLGWSTACIIAMLRLSPLFYQSLPCLFCDSCQLFMLRVCLLNVPRKLQWLESHWDCPMSHMRTIIFNLLWGPRTSESPTAKGVQILKRPLTPFCFKTNFLLLNIFFTFLRTLYRCTIYLDPTTTPSSSPFTLPRPELTPNLIFFCFSF